MHRLCGPTAAAAAGGDGEPAAAAKLSRIQRTNHDRRAAAAQEAPGQPPQVYVVPANPAYPPGYPYWAYDPYWGPRVAIGGTFVFGGGRGFRHHEFRR